MNIITVGGRLIKEIELKTSNNGKSWANFTIADNYYDNNEKKTNWFSCMVFGTTAEFLSKYAIKGDYISIIGELRQNKSENKTYYNILVSKAELGSTKQKTNDDISVVYDENNNNVDDFPF